MKLNQLMCPIRRALDAGVGRFVYDENFRRAVQRRPIFKFKFQSDNGNNMVIKQLPPNDGPDGEGTLNAQLSLECPNARHLLLGEVYQGDATVQQAVEKALKPSTAESTDLQTALDKLDLRKNNYLVMKEAGVDVRSWRKACKDQVSDRQKYIICQGTFQGIIELHDAGVGHQDIHQGQVTVYESRSGELEVKLFDFGMSKRKDETIRIPAGGFPPRNVDIQIWRYDFMRFSEFFFRWLDPSIKVSRPRHLRKFFLNPDLTEDACRDHIQNVLKDYSKKYD